MLTGGEIDQTAGLLNLRERQPFTLIGTTDTLARHRRQSDVRRARRRGDAARGRARQQPFAICRAELSAELFMVPGKVPLYLESDTPETAEESGANVGVEITARRRDARLRARRRRA